MKRALVTNTAGEYREDQLAKMTTNYESPHLNSSTSLEKAREEALDENLGYKEYKRLSISNKKLLNFCSVRKLSLSPFYMWYWLDEQLKL